MKVALLSNVTIGVLAEILKERHSVWMADGFGAVIEPALASSEELVNFGPEVIAIVCDHHFSNVRPVDVEVARSAYANSFPEVPVVVVDADSLASGRSEFHDERMWRLAAMPWSLGGIDAICEELEGVLASLDYRPRKVLALDLDNTLWEGIVSEVGPEGIVPRKEFQKGLKELQKRGILLAAFSKNDASTALAAFTNPEMVLRPEDFVAMRLDWSDKSDNLRAVAAELNLDPSAFVFIDDRFAERSRMRKAIPQVAVTEFPVRTDELVRRYFPIDTETTDTDLRRTELYRAAEARDAFANGRDLENYLRELAIVADVSEASPGDYPRVAELSQRANQFNLVSNRYTVDSLAASLVASSRRLYIMRVRDRFADDGLSAYAIVDFTEDMATIVDFTMSCRVMNRRVEFTFMSALEEQIRARGVGRIKAFRRENGRNGPTVRFYPDCGFSATTDPEVFLKVLDHSTVH